MDIEAIIRALQEVEQHIHIVGSTRPETLLWLLKEGELNIVSIDIGGNEKEFPPMPFADVYQRAKEMGLHLVAHAGEAAGAQSVWDTINYLKVERIGHGVAAKQDPELVDYFPKHNIAIEMCPTSNLRTGAVPSLQEHPIRTFFDKDIKVTTNTDDPSMFNTDMNNEYLQLHRRLNFTITELFQLTLNALSSSFLPITLKEQMYRCFLEEYQQLIDNGTVGGEAHEQD